MYKLIQRLCFYFLKIIFYDIPNYKILRCRIASFKTPSFVNISITAYKVINENIVNSILHIKRGDNTLNCIRRNKNKDKNITGKTCSIFSIYLILYVKF